MSAGTLYETDAPYIQVRIYDHDRLLTRELCESEADIDSVVERWSDLANLFVVADDPSATHEPDDILASEEPLMGDDATLPIAARPLPGCGTDWRRAAS